MSLSIHDLGLGISRQTRDRSGTDNDYLCHPCFRIGRRIKANGFCEDCGEYMCKICFKDHVKIKSLQQHVLRENKAQPKSVSIGTTTEKQFADRKLELKKRNRKLCARHKEHILEYYCSFCNEAGCIACVEARHDSCYVVCFPDVPEHLLDLEGEIKTQEGSEKIETYKEILQWMGVVRKRINLVAAKQVAHEKECDRKREVCTTELGDFYDDMNFYMDVLCEIVSTVADTDRKKTKDNCRLVVDRANETLSHLAQLQDGLESINVESRLETEARLPASTQRVKAGSCASASSLTTALANASSGDEQDGYESANADYRLQTEEQSGTVRNFLCQPCFRVGGRMKADGFCIDCAEYMCKICYEDHVKIKSLQQHVLRENKKAHSKSVTVGTLTENSELKIRNQTGNERSDDVARNVHLTRAVNALTNLRQSLRCVPCTNKMNIGQIPDVLAGIQALVKNTDTDATPTSRMPRVIDRLDLQTKWDVSPCHVTKALVTPEGALVADAGNKKIKIVDFGRKELLTEMPINSLFP